jgi:catalase
MAGTNQEHRSGDVARDVRGFATRFYTDAGNLDIVGINLPIFFIQDAIQFPDMVHALKPQPDKQIPQAATAHDTAYDFFSQQPSTLNMVSNTSHTDSSFDANCHDSLCSSCQATRCPVHTAT